MGAQSKIEWTDATWPIVQGCDPVSQGCVNCYAVPLLHRLAWNPNPTISAPLKGLVEWYEPRDGKGFLRFTGKLALREDRLTWPLQWKKPRRIFVPSHGDIFHKDVPDEFLDKIFAVMALCPQHTFQVLTKRAERMRSYVTSRSRDGRYLERQIVDAASEILRHRQAVDIRYVSWDLPGWPLPNVWLGISAERQEEADERIPHLLATPAAIRFVSAEPLLGPIDLTRIELPTHALCDALSSRRDGAYVASPATLDWVIVGGESGSHARPFHLQWADDLIDQCRSSRVSCFVKQLGSNPVGASGPFQLQLDRKGGEPAEWPMRLAVREFPKAAA